MNHGFNLDCLPTPFMGRLRTAPVVLLYLSPGLKADFDPWFATQEQGKDWHLAQWSGNALLPSVEEHEPAYRWWSSRARQFWPEVDSYRDSLAILDIGAYHSQSFGDWPTLSALPSSRYTLDWVQSVLFPQGEAGKRIVICMRSGKYWGLSDGRSRYGVSLFAPSVTRGGFIKHGQMREEIAAIARAAVMKNH